MKLLTHEISTPWGKIASVVDVTNNPTVIGAGFKPLSKLIKQLPEKYQEYDFNLFKGVTVGDNNLFHLENVILSGIYNKTII